MPALQRRSSRCCAETAKSISVALDVLFKPETKKTAEALIPCPCCNNYPTKDTAGTDCEHCGWDPAAPSQAFQPWSTKFNMPDSEAPRLAGPHWESSQAPHL